jgi:hypothetical protein
MNPAAGFGFGNPLNPVHAGFELEPRKIRPFRKSVAMISL